MIFRAKRSYKIRNIFFNRDIICSRERKYKLTRKPSNNIYLIRKEKQKKLRLF